MKKLILSISLLALSAAPVLAASPDAISMDSTGLSLYGCKGSGCTPPVTDQGRIARTSTGVGIGLATDPSGYSVATQHKNGTKVYGSAHDSTSIYVKNAATKGTAESITYTTGKDTFEGVDGWSTM